MKDKILSALKTKYKSLGFGDTAMSGVADFLAATITDEEAIDTGISGIEGLLKNFQKEIDRRVNASQEPKPAVPPTKETVSEPLTEMQKAIAEAMKPITEQIAALKAQRQVEDLSQKLVTELSARKVDPLFYTPAIEGRTFTDETQIQTFATDLETKFKAYQQQVANQGLEGQGQPQKGDVTQLGKKAVLDDIARLADF